MNNPRGIAYLQAVLSLDPAASAREMLAKRRDFLRPTDVTEAEDWDAEIAGEDFRAKLLQQLEAVRRDFWQLDRAELTQRLMALQITNNAETASAAARLRQVAEQRKSLLQLQAQSGVHQAFVRAFAEILVAPALQANRLREREHCWMRPEQNPHYESARIAIQETVQVIRVQYPELFFLEEGWLAEVLEYNPLDETASKFSTPLFRLVAIMVAIVGVGATLLTIFLIVLGMCT